MFLHYYELWYIRFEFYKEVGDLHKDVLDISAFPISCEFI